MSKNDDRIDADPVVRQIATAMGSRATRNLKDDIVARAVGRVERWMKEASVEPERLDDVHDLICNMTRVKIVRVNNDYELERAKAELPPAVPVQLDLEFGAETEAVVVKRDGADHRGSQFIAIVDARGNRASRAWFAERHEPSHLIIPDKGAGAIWRRTKAERPEPLEQVVDAVASAIGFWPDLVRRQITASRSDAETLLEALEHSHMMLAPGASKASAYLALIAHVEHPTLVVWSDVAPRRGKVIDPSTYALRIQTILANDAARRHGLTIWENFRVPPDSAIAIARGDALGTLHVQMDNLARWPTTSGRPLPSATVHVTARAGWATIEMR